jgi:hypothetical protein
MPTLRTWQATYPPIGLPEAIATVVDLEDGSFLVGVVATGRTEDRRYPWAPVSRLHGTLAEAQARADAAAVELLGRDVAGRWHGPLGGEGA